MINSSNCFSIPSFHFALHTFETELSLRSSQGLTPDSGAFYKKKANNFPEISEYLLSKTSLFCRYLILISSAVLCNFIAINM